MIDPLEPRRLFSSFAFKVVDAGTDVGLGAGVNNAGQVAFVDNHGVYIASSTGAKTTVSRPNSGNQVSPHVTLNDGGDVVWQQQNGVRTAIETYDHGTVEESNSLPEPMEQAQIVTVASLGPWPTLNNVGDVAYPAARGTWYYQEVEDPLSGEVIPVLTPISTAQDLSLKASGASTPTDLTIPPPNQVQFPELADDGRVVINLGTTATAAGIRPILIWDKTFTTPELVAGASRGFTVLGTHPAISPDGRVAIFAGTLGVPATLNTFQAGLKYADGTKLAVPTATAGDGVFASVQVDGVTDAAGTAVPRVVVPLAGTTGTVALKSFDLNGGLAVNRLGAGRPGATVVYTATNAAGKAGVFVSHLTLAAAAGKAWTVSTPASISTDAPSAVALAGDSVAGVSGALQSFVVGDAVNDSDEVAFAATTKTGQRAVVTAIPLPLSITDAKVVPDAAPDLHLKAVFGTEELDVPLVLPNLGTTGTATVKLSVSTSSTGSPAVALPAVDQVTYGGKPHAGAAVSLTGATYPLNVTARVKLPSTLTAGTSYYLVATVTGSTAGETLSATSAKPYEYLGSVGGGTPASIFTGTQPWYFRFMRDLLNPAGIVWPGGYSAVKTDGSAATFMKIVEGDRLDPYLDSAEIPTIGIGVNLNALTSALAAQLAKAVRSFFANPPASVTDDWGPASTASKGVHGTTTITAAKRSVYLAINAAYRYDPSKAPIPLSKASDAQVVAMLKAWAAGSPPVGVVTTGGTTSTVTLGRHDKALSNADDLSLFNAAFAVRASADASVPGVQSAAQLGTAAWARINNKLTGNAYTRQAVAVMSFFYNVGSFTKPTDPWPGLQAALKSTSGPNGGPDYLAAVFQLANSTRTTQVGFNRTEAEIEDLLSGSTSLVGEWVTT